MATEWTTWPRATDEELRSWSVARGDDAGRAARRHADVSAENQALRERAEAAEAAIKRQAGAAATLRTLTLSEVQHLKDMDRSEYNAARTVDGEREANAMLTDEIERLEAALTAARRAEAAAWNDAIEAAAEKCATVVEGQRYFLNLPGYQRRINDKLQIISRGCADDIRALRRAAPTEEKA